MYASHYTTPSATSFSFPARRNTRPEIFTFDAVPEQQQRTSAPRQRRRVARVMYPAKVRRYLPPAERSPAKRLLLALCLLLLAQIYTERADDELHETGAGAGGEATSIPESGEESALAHPLFLSFQSADQSARSLADCSAWSNRTQKLQQRAQPSTRNNGYVVALLYPVYHTLGTEQ